VRRELFIILLFCIWQSAWSANLDGRIDSLLDRARKAYPDAKAYEFANKALAIATDNNIPVGISRSNYYLGYFYHHANQSVKALTHYLNATNVEVDISNPEHVKWVIFSYIKTSNLFSEYQLFDQSIRILKRTEAYCNGPACEHYALVQYNLQQKYRKAGKYNESLAVLNQMKAAFPRESNDHFKALNGIGIVFNERGQLKKAISHYKNLIEQAKNFDNQKYLNMARHNLADAYYHSGQLTEAKEILLTLVEADAGFDSETSYFTTYKDLITILCELGEYNEALRIWSRAKPTVEEASVDRGEFYEIYKDVALAYEHTGKKDLAADYEKLYEEANEKFLNTQSDLEQNHKRTNFLYTQAQLKATMQAFYADLEKERKYIQRQNLLIAISIGLTALIVIMLTYYFYKNYKMKKWLTSEINKLESME